MWLKERCGKHVRNDTGPDNDNFRGSQESERSGLFIGDGTWISFHSTSPVVTNELFWKLLG